MSSQLDLQELKRRVGSSPFTKRIKFVDGYSACPFHNGDGTKTFHLLKKEDGTFIGTCFSECGEKNWDAIAFVKQFDKVDTAEAVRRLSENEDSDKSLLEKRFAAPITTEQWKTCGRVVTATDVAELAASRPYSATPSALALNALGFRITDMGDRRFLVAPYRLGDVFYTIKGRNLAAKEFVQENSVSQRGLFNIDAVPVSGDVYVVESELDVAVLHEQGYTAVSVNNAKQKSIEVEVLKKLNTAYRIFLVGDSDEAGVACMNAIAQLLPPEKVYRMPLDVKDVGELAFRIQQDPLTFGSFQESWEQRRKEALASWIARHIPFVSEIPNEPQLWTIDKLLPLSGYLLISGKYGAMKSLMALYLASCIESGTPAFGRAVIKAPVLYLDRENPRQTIGERRVGLGIPDNQIRYWGDWLADATPSLDDPRLAEFAIRERGVLIFDSLQDWLNGVNENDPSAMTEISHKLRRLARLGGGVIVLHHSDKYRSNYRGTTAIPSGSDMALRIAKTEDNIIEMREERFRSCATWEMDVQFFFEGGKNSITYQVLRDGSPTDRRKAEAAEALDVARDVLNLWHAEHDGAGMPKTRLVAALRERGVSKDKATGVISAGAKSKMLWFETGDRGAILYHLSDWKAPCEIRF
jgi:hypothetical protein